VRGSPFSVHKVIVFLGDGGEIVPELTWPMYQEESASDAAIFAQLLAIWISILNRAVSGILSHYLNGRGCWKFH
jgi:hypothetical protein